MMLSWHKDLMEVSGQTCLTPEGHPALLNQPLKVSVAKQTLFDGQRLSVVVSEKTACIVFSGVNLDCPFKWQIIEKREFCKYPNCFS